MKEAVVIDFQRGMRSPTDTDTDAVVAKRVVEDAEARFATERPDAP